MTTPFVSLEQFALLGKTQFEKSLRLANLQLNSYEKLTQLGMNLAKDVLAEQAAAFKSVSEVKDVPSFFAFQNGLAQPSVEKAVTTSRALYEALTDVQAEFAAFAEEEAQVFNRTIVSGLDNLVKNAPAGSDVAVAAIKSAIAAAGNAYDTVSKAAKQVTTELVEVSNTAVEASASSAAAKPAATAARRKPASAA
ncbi:phasin family protein [Leeia sp. TBRC 13508]|uniref:Phasin family protein n=1 Tax=Leeia speluncae TaxID=2884804 RepID=A0ABS8D6I2_9NEIS|nr:phasin family protein [Leeia speluncae]MCB6183819.1 phasin family protein [Leeia speluncae]